MKSNDWIAPNFANAETGDRVIAELESGLAGEQQARHVARGFRRQRDVADAALVDDERRDAFGLPRDELLVELPARRHPHM